MQAAPPTGAYAARDVTKPPDWHGLVVWDLFLNALATGLFLVAALCDLARPGTVTPWVYPLALVLLLADLACLVLDLGDPLRFHHMLRVFKPSSPMSLGTWCLTAYSLPLTALVAVDLLAALGVGLGLAWLRTALIVVALPFAFGSAAYKGVLFSTTAQPGWRDARWLGAYHVSGAVACGAAVLLMLSTAIGQPGESLRHLLVAALVVHLIPAAFLARELYPALVECLPRSTVGRDISLIGGGGIVAPFALLLTAGSLLSAAAAGLVLAGAWLARHVIVLLPHRPKVG